ncbi:MAG TPA: cytidine deaminase [Anaerolineaceae bacterium]|nr:cytidine deaminase [Chloroflexota bacterium]HNY83286.1 cytidine deaminase [Anaerolineaceae bacterium]
MDKKTKEKLVQAALEAQKQAYAPYSKFKVGAAVLAEDGIIYKGANIENAAYPSTICAERSAIVTAISAGNRKVNAIAVVTRNAGSPCGACRQVMREFGGVDLPILIANEAGEIVDETDLSVLLPRSFGPEDLEE